MTVEDAKAYAMNRWKELVGWDAIDKVNQITKELHENHRFTITVPLFNAPFMGLTKDQDGVVFHAPAR